MCKRLCALLLGAFLAAFSLFGQSGDGTIVGTVLDASGAGVPNATVLLQNMDTGVKTSTKTDAAGSYRFNNILVGRYTATATAAGFTTTSLKDLAVELNKATTANIRVDVGSVSTAIDVMEAATTIDTTTAQVANTFETRMAADIPSSANPNGGVLNLSLLGAGITSAGGFGTGTGPSVGGQRPRNNNFMIDGVDNNRKDVTGPVLAIPNDAVAEFTLLQNQFSAEFGHSSGGQFNTVLRGGTNEIHGLVYDYLQNRNLNAIDQANARQGILTNPRFDQNRLGASIGGPIRKNKLFYYGLYEYNPLGQASVPSGGATYSPTAAGYAALSSMSGLSATNLGILKQYLPAAATQSKTTTVNGVAIPLGILPISAPNFANTYSWLVSIDYNISDKDQLRGRYVDNKISSIDINANLPVFFNPRPTTSHLGSVSEFHNFRPNLTNEIRLAFNRYNDNISVPDFKYPGLDVFPNLQIKDDLNVQIGPNPNGPQATIQTTYQINDNVSWSKGKHDFKFGFDGRSLISASTFIQRVRGDYEYTVLERFLQDKVPNSLAERNVGGKPYSGNNIALYGYANDNWKVTRNLNLNLGVRYEFTSVPKSMKEFALNSIADVPGVLTFAAPQPQKKNFAPRLGFAYSPGTSGTTSLRGGFGMAYDQVFDNVGTNARPPQATSTIDSPVTEQTGYLAAGGILPTAQAAALTPAQARAATSSYLPGLIKPGYSINWNLGIQHVFANDYTVDVRYVGTRGVHLLYQLQINRAGVVTPTHFLPTYLAAPSQAALDSLPLTLDQITAERNTPGIGNTLAQYGFTSNITAYVPRGNSEYHGLAVEVTKRYTAHNLFKASYTWSHLMDDSTAEVNSTTLSPRRPQDFNNIRNEWASSLLDRRQRFSFTWLYEAPWFQRDNSWFKRNLLGNYQIAGTYTVESPEYGTPQSGVDSNQNGDAAADRAIVNSNGTPGTSSDVTALKNSAGATVGYLAINPNAQFIRAQVGALANSGRNILATRGINNWDLSVSKSLAFNERMKLQLRADLFNGFNHPQYTPGKINTVGFVNRSGVTNYLTPGNPVFGQFDQVYSSNPRTVQVAARLTF
uniref:Cna B domain protein n=1 Tax=Solibacter usitatus (strain Ellin6076) TaxID=234267 RepID=Q026A2_SOLUE